ncbi:MAG: DNA polymerase/3'-5' exonuclease PolX [Candidatus Firestonebacteria bacterium]|nr:DNA polymerase/3'-5' exonuclease PolX [Candidatus Firestonebacteria bacterium]
MNNYKISAIFEEIANILEVQNDNPFRIRSYHNAARIIKDMSEEIVNIINENRTLENIPGIGKGIEEKIEEIVKTGTCILLKELHGKFPQGLIELLKIEGLGPKKIKLLYEKLGVDSVKKLYDFALSGKIRDLEGMGEKTEIKILKSIENYNKGFGRYKLSIGFIFSEAVIKYLIKNARGVIKIEPAGSLRRRQETIGDLDLLAICSSDTDIMDKFVEYDDIKEILMHGETKSVIKLSNGLQVDLRVLDEDSFGAALHHFTGSKSHNIAIRDRAKEMGFKINEYGIFDNKDKKIGGKLEEDIYHNIGLKFIAPELRENMGEIEASLNGTLPDLIEKKQIRGDLQMHTIESDGKNTVQEMAQKAKELGYEYIAITNHSKAVKVAHGLDEKRLRNHLEQIDLINEQGSAIHILKGIEADVLADGSMDLGNDILKKCDVVIAAIHSHFNLPEKEMTKRIIKALENPYVNILGHPTGRLILEREPYAVNLNDIFKAAYENNVIMEINAYPDRLDLKDIHARQAKEMGLKLVISTDAHSALQMEMMDFGIFAARRAWLESNDIINTYPLKQLKVFLNKK